LHLYFDEVLTAASGVTTKQKYRTGKRVAAKQLKVSGLKNAIAKFNSNTELNIVSRQIFKYEYNCYLSTNNIFVLLVLTSY